MLNIFLHLLFHEHYSCEKFIFLGNAGISSNFL